MGWLQNKDRKYIETSYLKVGTLAKRFSLSVATVIKIQKKGKS